MIHLPNRIANTIISMWKTVAGVNYIKKIDVSDKDLTGTLVTSQLTYLQSLVISGNKFAELDVSGCKRLELLSCYNCRLETLTFGGNDSLLYLDCLDNCLSIEDIEEECKRIQEREGGEARYEDQFINADRVAFCEEECAVLEAFANLPENKGVLNWDFSKPGMIPEIEWTIVDGIYRVEEINLLGRDVHGILDLSTFDELEKLCLIATELEEVYLPDTMSEVSEKMFMNCANLTKVVLPSNLKKIGNYAFSGCTKLEQIELPESLEKIGKEAFAGCKALREVTVGANVKSIGTYAFVGCDNLELVTFLGDAPASMGENVFYRTSENLCIYHRAESSGWDDECWSGYDVKVSEDSEELPEVSTSPAPQSTTVPTTTSCPTSTLSPEETPGATNLPAVKPEQSEAPQPSGTPRPEETESPDNSPCPSEPSRPVEMEKPLSTQSPESGPSASAGETRQEISQENGSGTVIEQSGNSSLSQSVDKKLTLKKVKIMKCKLKKRKLHLVVQKQKGVSGYEISYRKGKKGKIKKTHTKSWKKNKVTLRKLKKKTTYYVRVRAYKVVGGKRCYSAYSKWKKVKVK